MFKKQSIAGQNFFWLNRRNVALIILLISLNWGSNTYLRAFSKTESLNMFSTNNDQELTKHLKENGIKYKVSPEGIFYTIEKEGGEKPKAGQYVKVHYRGTLLDGTPFDASYDRNEPFVFGLGEGRVIQGWDKGIPLVGVGGKGTLYLKSDLAYGARGAGDAIPPNANLIFEIEVLAVMTAEEYQVYMEAEQERRMQAYKAAMAKQLEVDVAIIEEHAATNNLELQKTESGLYYQIERQGEGTKAEAGKAVTVHYRGTLLDGTPFDASYDRNQPFSFKLGEGQVIQGWDEGIALFNVGGKGTLYIPSTMAYGPRKMGPIPANAVLIFGVELLDVK